MVGRGEIPPTARKAYCFLSLIRKSPKFQTREKESRDILLFRRTFAHPLRLRPATRFSGAFILCLWSCRAFGDASYH